MKKRIIISSLAIVIVVLLLYVGKRLVEEKYCYNVAFTSLDKKGIRLGNVSQEFKNKGFSPLQIGTVSGFKEWWAVYEECYNHFDLFKINTSILMKSYPNYAHFIDL